MCWISFFNTIIVSSVGLVNEDTIPQLKDRFDDGFSISEVLNLGYTMFSKIGIFFLSRSIIDGYDE